MATQLQLRRGTTSENASFTGAVGEVTVDTTKDTLIVQDGSTAGGFELARADGSNFVATSVDINGGTIDGTTIGASSASTGAFTTLTASTGIDVTGTATMDGLTVENTSGSTTALIRAAGGGNNSATLDLTSRGSGNQYRNTEIVSVGENSPTAKLQFKLDNSLGNLSKALEIDGNGDISFYEDTGTTPKMVWSASAESLGIGTTSPDNLIDIFNSDSASIRIRATNTAATLKLEAPIPSIELTDTSGSASDAVITMDGNALTFDIDASEAMRIDSSGNLLVGKTSSDLGVTKGFEYYVGGGDSVAFLTRSNNPSAIFNRLGSNGTIAQFRKDGTTVGSIGADAGYLTIGKGDTGLLFQDGGDAIQPRSISGLANRDAAIDLGVSGGRFKDLYLSGGVYLGGTGAANKLDDYEEGTWTPTFNYGTGITYTSQVGSYTKIGSLVTVTFDIQVSALGSDTDEVHLSLPFSPTAGFCVYTCSAYASTLVHGGGNGAPTSGHTANVARLSGSNLVISENDGERLSYSDLQSSGRISGAVTYRTTA